MSINIPIGVWETSYSVALAGQKLSATSIQAFSTLSTSNNSESDADFTASVYSQAASGNIEILDTVSREKVLELSSKATYYLNTSTPTANANKISNYGAAGSKTIIRAISAYL